MIDATAFCYFNPGSNFILRVQTRLDRDNLTEEQFMICSPVILGFCFGSKQWGMYLNHAHFRVILILIP